VFVHRDPARGVYRSIVQLRGNSVLRPLRLPGISLAVRDLFRARR
jgi:hypothetical protein